MLGDEESAIHMNIALGGPSGIAETFVFSSFAVRFVRKDLVNGHYSQVSDLPGSPTQKLPHVLVVNSIPQIVKALSSDSRCSVTAAILDQDQGDPSPALGDPRQYQIVVVDFVPTLHTFAGGAYYRPMTPEELGEEFGLSVGDVSEMLQYHTVTKSFLNEVRSLGGVFLQMASGTKCVRELESHNDVYGQSGHQIPEFDITTEPDAIHFAPYVAEFGSRLGRRRVSLPLKYKSFVENQYGETAVCFRDEQLVAMSAEDVADKPSQIHHLVTRSLFGMHPRVLAGEANSAVLDELEKELERVDQAYTEERNDVLFRITEEQEFLAEHSPLFAGTDDLLKHAVIQAFQSLGFAVEDLDDRPGPKTLDVYLPELAITIETRAKSTRNSSLSDISRIAEHADTLRETDVGVTHPVFVLNGQVAIPFDQRDDLFSAQVAQRAEDEKITLLSGQQLFDALLTVRSGATTKELFAERLRKPGPFSLI